MIAIYSTLQPDLEIVNQRIYKETILRGKRLPGFTWPVLNRIDTNFLPSLVLLSSRAQGHTGPRAVSLAAVMQFIFLASLIHGNVKKDPAVKILSGDYFYACFFNLLCRDGNLVFLKPLSQLICEIHLHEIKKLRLDNNSRTKFNDEERLQENKHTREQLAATAAFLGSQLGIVSSKEAANWREAGLLLGKIWNGRFDNKKAIKTLNNFEHGPVKNLLSSIISNCNIEQTHSKVIAF